MQNVSTQILLVAKGGKKRKLGIDILLSFIILPVSPCIGPSHNNRSQTEQEGYQEHSL